VVGVDDWSWRKGSTYGTILVDLERRQFAGERRAKAEALLGLSKEILAVTPKISAQIARAITEYGSAAYTTPSGLVLDLLTQLTEENDPGGFSHAFIILAHTKLANAAFVAAAVPARITSFLIQLHGVEASALMRWTNANPGWEDDLKNTMRNPTQFA
jgi:hypothetical protein